MNQSVNYNREVCSVSREVRSVSREVCSVSREVCSVSRELRSVSQEELCSVFLKRTVSLLGHRNFQRTLTLLIFMI